MGANVGARLKKGRKCVLRRESITSVISLKVIVQGFIEPVRRQFVGGMGVWSVKTIFWWGLMLDAQMGYGMISVSCGEAVDEVLETIWLSETDNGLGRKLVEMRL
jgi:hypothetical protein